MKNIGNYIMVDDDSSNNLIFQFIIRKFDPQASIQVFKDPEEALIHIKKAYTGNREMTHTFLFLDVNMPVMNGWEFLDTFREYDQYIKNQFTIYMLSSSVDDYEEEAIKYPMVSGFFPKPLKMDYLHRITADRSPVGMEE